MPIFSSGKSVASILMGMMRQEEKLKYDSLVMDYWPEFNSNGLEILKVEDVMRHEAGLSRLHKQIT